MRLARGKNCDLEDRGSRRQMDYDTGWHIQEGIKARRPMSSIETEPGRATVPTALGDLNVGLGSGKLKIVDGRRCARPPTLRRTRWPSSLSTAVAAADTDKALVLSILVALESARPSQHAPYLLGNLKSLEFERPRRRAFSRPPT